MSGPIFTSTPVFSKTDRGLITDRGGKTLLPMVLCLNTLVLLLCGFWLTSFFTGHVIKSECNTQLFHSIHNHTSHVVQRYILDNENVREHFHGCAAPSKDYTATVKPMKRAHVFKSAKVAKAESITIVTQLSLGRLNMLMNQCMVWHDRIAAVVYSPLLVTNNTIFSTDTANLEWDGLDVPTVIEKLKWWHAHIDRGAGCTLDLEFAVEEFESKEDPVASLYPVNALRNRAHMLAETEAIVLLDVDFLPSAGLVSDYRRPGGYSDMMQQLAERKLIVLPAFLTTGKQGPEAAIAGALMGKEGLIEAFEQKKLDAFSQCGYSCHGITDYPKWFKANESYPVMYKKPYEPYFLAAKAFVPWYDERFRGYYQNKIMHRVHISVLGVQFLVHPRHYVIHMFHTKSSTYGATRVTNTKEHNFELAAKIRNEASAGEFLPVTSFYDDKTWCAANKVVALKTTAGAKKSSSSHAQEQ